MLKNSLSPRLVINVLEVIFSIIMKYEFIKGDIF